MSSWRSRLPGNLATYAFVLGVRGIYVLMRLVIVLGLPFLLGPAALGQFGTFSALVAILPMIVGLGIPQHVIRRLAVSTHPPSFRTLILHIVIGAIMAMLVTAAWLRVYPEIAAVTGVLVAIVAGIEVVRAAGYSLAISRSSIIRANISYLLSVVGPSLAVLTGLVFLNVKMDLALVVAFWIATSLASTAVASTVITRDFRKAPKAATSWLALRRRYAASIIASRNIYLNQIVDVARVYCDRLIVPLFAGFFLAGVYNFLALGANMAVMICNATFGQTDLPRLMRATADGEWHNFDRIVAAGLKRTMLFPLFIMAPLLVLKPIAELVLKTPLDAKLYYPLALASMMVAVAGSLADYLWYAVYASKGERELARTAFITVPLGLILVTVGTWGFGLIGAALGMALTSGTVSWLRWQRLSDHLEKLKGEVA